MSRVTPARPALLALALALSSSALAVPGCKANGGSGVLPFDEAAALAAEAACAFDDACLADRDGLPVEECAEAALVRYAEILPLLDRTACAACLSALGPAYDELRATCGSGAATDAPALADAALDTPDALPVVPDAAPVLADAAFLAVAVASTAGPPARPQGAHPSVPGTEAILANGPAAAAEACDLVIDVDADGNGEPADDFDACVPAGGLTYARAAIAYATSRCVFDDRCQADADGVSPATCQDLILEESLAALGRVVSSPTSCAACLEALAGDLDRVASADCDAGRSDVLAIAAACDREPTVDASGDGDPRNDGDACDGAILP